MTKLNNLTPLDALQKYQNLLMREAPESWRVAHYFAEDTIEGAKKILDYYYPDHTVKDAIELAKIIVQLKKTEQHEIF